MRRVQNAGDAVVDADRGGDARHAVGGRQADVGGAVVCEGVVQRDARRAAVEDVCEAGAEGELGEGEGGGRVGPHRHH